MKVSVIIVSYNAKFYLEQCLRSVEKSLISIDSEIIVVDNASPEKTLEFIAPKFSNVTFIASKKNLGFAKANNLGVAKAKGEYVLILNPDTLVPENLFNELLPFADKQKKLGAIGVHLIDANGKFHPESKRNIPTIRNTFGKLFGSILKRSNANNYYDLNIKEFEVGKTSILVGAFMLLKKETYLTVGGFDESYFMYGEDIDLSYSLLKNGFTNYYYGKISVLHYKGESTRKDKKYLKTFFNAMKIFLKKYYKKKIFTYILLRLGLLIRYYISLLFSTNEPKKNLKTLDINTLFEPNSIDEIKLNKTLNILLNGDFFTYKDIINYLVSNRSFNNEVYIKPTNMSVIIGNNGVHHLKH